MDLFLAALGFILVLLGIIGAFLPVLPGPLTSWVGLLLLHLTKTVPQDTPFLGVTFAIAAGVWLLDYIIPAIGTKWFGGSKYGMYGTSIGLILGLISPIPFGIIIGAFTGALVGEMIGAKKEFSKALKAAFGALLGFFASSTLKFIVALVYFGLFLNIVWTYRTALFT